MKISIETEVAADAAAAWRAWTTPADITSWNFASDDWCCPHAQIDPVAGGRFCYRMESRDGTMGFDFEGEFTEDRKGKSLRFRLDDGREVSVEFIEIPGGVRVVETFEAEDIHTPEQQREGWLAILQNFKRHVESQSE